MLRTEPRGAELFLRGTWELVCERCGIKHAPHCAELRGRTFDPPEAKRYVVRWSEGHGWFRRSCAVCGQTMEKVNIVAELQDDDGDRHHICDDCVGAGPEGIRERCRDGVLEVLTMSTRHWSGMMLGDESYCRLTLVLPFRTGGAGTHGFGHRLAWVSVATRSSPRKLSPPATRASGTRVKGVAYDGRTDTEAVA